MVEWEEVVKIKRLLSQPFRRMTLHGEGSFFFFVLQDRSDDQDIRMVDAWMLKKNVVYSG